MRIIPKTLAIARATGIIRQYPRSLVHSAHSPASFQSASLFGKKSLFGKTIDKFPNRLKIEFIGSCENDKIVKQQSKLTISGVHKSYTNYKHYTFKQNEVLMAKLIYIGFAVLELSRLRMHESNFDKLQLFFWRKFLSVKILIRMISTKYFIKR